MCTSIAIVHSTRAQLDSISRFVAAAHRRLFGRGHRPPPGSLGDPLQTPGSEGALSTPPSVTHMPGRAPAALRRASPVQVAVGLSLALAMFALILQFSGRSERTSIELMAGGA